MCRTLALTLAFTASATALTAQDKLPRPVFDPGGTVHAPAFDLPVS